MPIIIAPFIRLKPFLLSLHTRTSRLEPGLQTIYINIEWWVLWQPYGTGSIGSSPNQAARYPEKRRPWYDGSYASSRYSTRRHITQGHDARNRRQQYPRPGNNVRDDMTSSRQPYRRLLSYRSNDEEEATPTSQWTGTVNSGCAICDSPHHSGMNCPHIQ